MYHISQDKRSVRSAELIYQGLLQCLERKPFEHITVTDLQRASGVARTTIYRCFDRPSDILFWRCDRCFQASLHSVPPTAPADERQLIQGYFTYWTQHSDILKLLMDLGRQDIIYTCHMRNAETLAQSHGPLPGLDGKKAKYFMAIRTGVTIAVLKTWLENGRQETAGELAELVLSQFPPGDLLFASNAPAPK